MKSREIVGAEGSKGHLGGLEHCGMCYLHIGAIGQADQDAIFGGEFVGEGTVGA